MLAPANKKCWWDSCEIVKKDPVGKGGVCSVVLEIGVDALRHTSGHNHAKMIEAHARCDLSHVCIEACELLRLHVAQNAVIGIVVFRNAEILAAIGVFRGFGLFADDAEFAFADVDATGFFGLFSGVALGYMLGEVPGGEILAVAVIG